MVELSHKDRKQLREAILSAYPDPHELEIFVSEELNRNIYVIAGGSNYRTVVFNLIKWAIAKGVIDDLILAFQRNIPDRQDVQYLCGRILAPRLVLNNAECIQELGELPLEPSAWDVDIYSEELQGLIPRRFSLEADVGELIRGLELANSVCKITVPSGIAMASGTGVVIAPNLVLTNHHVLGFEEDTDLNEVARTCRFEFGYVSPKFGEIRHTEIRRADDEKPVIKSSPVELLDYALIRLQRGSGKAINPVPLNPTTELAKNSPLNLLQHPEGEELKVSLSNNGVVKTNEALGLVLYVNPTRLGSSGSPCFNSNWELVALHHKGLVTSFGSIREGVLFSAIYREISDVL